MSSRHHRPTSTELHCSCLVVACWRHGLCLEKQVGLLQHDHGHVVKDWIASWNLDIPWSKVLGLADVVPRMRVRLWLLARRSMIPWSSLVWPEVVLPTLQQFDVSLVNTGLMGANFPLMFEDEFWSCQLASTGSISLSGKALLNFLLVCQFSLACLCACACSRCTAFQDV
jgi:hypothetical protein